LTLKNQENNNLAETHSPGRCQAAVQLKQERSRFLCPDPELKPCYYYGV